MSDYDTVWLLRLNDMRAAQVEIRQTVAVASSREALERYLDSEVVPNYTTDNRWHKAFREGGPLEWYNPPWGPEGLVCIGTKAAWLDRAARDWDEIVTRAPRVD